MALSLAFGSPEPGHPEKLMRLISKNRTFFNAFKASHGEVCCKDLIKLDVFTDAGVSEFMDKNIKKAFCAALVAETIDILETLVPKGKSLKIDGWYITCLPWVLSDLTL